MWLCESVLTLKFEVKLGSIIYCPNSIYYYIWNKINEQLRLKIFDNL